MGRGAFNDLCNGNIALIIYSFLQRMQCVQPVASDKPKPAATGKRKEPVAKGKGGAAKKAAKAR
jgi:hypothetical protein